MPRSNYSYAKRQREIAKKKKKDAKRLQKLARREGNAPDTDDSPESSKTDETSQ